MNKPVLLLYGRSGCHLCDDMLAVLEDLRGEHGFEIDVRDVDSRPDWRGRYDRLVPVLMCGDEEICRYFPDIAKMREVLGRFR